ncbi:hypothetical protein B7494_g1119 [Chlorociboria aeruginascens]|nr:hypothetical protein B7494_g1119 [Chlorociboria aeruginascens]
MQLFQVLSSLVVLVAVLSTFCRAQLSGTVGPTTSTATKAAKKICSVLDYGAKADKSTDLGPPLASAFAACKKWWNSGDYAMATWQTLDGGSGWALQLDGIIYRTGTAGGHMIVVENTSDFEFFSRTSKGAIQGYGYTFLSQGTYGPRLIRLISVKNFSFHDLILVDSPAFHLIVDGCTNGEVYNVIIRGANEGGLDGIDSSGTNLWYHDIEVTNKDECVTIKTPSSYTLVENIYCNWSGGCAMGSFGSGTAVSNIEYNNIYTWQSNQMFMIKSNGGDGYIRDCTFSNFIGHSNAYALDINEYWSSETVVAGNGVTLSGLTFSNWQGTIVDPKRASINVVCADAAPCTGISLSNIAFWTDTNAAMHYYCESAYGSGYCLKSGSGSSYTTTQSIASAPTGYSGAKMADDLPSGLGLSVSIAIPTIPTSFYPGVTPISKLLNGSGAGAGSGTTSVVGTTVSTSAAATTTAVSGSCGAVYAQCGGTGWAGATCCVSGSTSSQAKCSCGENSALHCTCAKSAEENKIEGPRCSCRARRAGECTCDRASTENATPSGSLCDCGARPAANLPRKSDEMETPLPIRLAQATGITASAFAAGVSFTLSFLSIPMMLQAPTPLLLQQWAAMYNRGKKTVPPIGVVAALAYFYLASKLPPSSDKTKFYAYIAAGILGAGLGPFTLLVIKPTNDALFKRLEETSGLSQKDKVVEIGGARKSAHQLVDYWGVLNLGRTFMLAVATGLGVWSVVN